MSKSHCRSLALTTAFAFIASVTAFGASLPKYETAAYCKSMVEAAADTLVRNFMMDGCLTLERQWATRIEAHLDSFNDKTLDRCDKLARASTGGSYQMFAGCLVTDLSDRFFRGEIDLVPRR